MQEKIVSCQNRVVLAVAGPGSGKSTTIKHKTNWISGLGEGAKPLILTFNQHSAIDIREKVKGKADVFTYHAFALHYIHDNLEQFVSMKRYPQGVIPTVLDEETEREIVLRYCEERRIKVEPKQANLRWISLQKPSLSKDLLWEIIELGLIRYEDLVPIATDLIKAYPNFKYDYVLLDEAQDSSLDQWQLVTAFYNHPAVKQILIFGDIDQSIYEWRDAVPKRFLEIVFELGAETLPLTVSYRNPVTVIDSANKLIANNSFRFDKQILPRENAPMGEINYIDFDPTDSRSYWKMVDGLVEKVKLQLNTDNDSTIAILCRTNRDLNYVNSCLESKNITVKTHNPQAQDPFIPILLSLIEVVCEGNGYNRMATAGMKLIDPKFDTVKFYLETTKSPDYFKRTWPGLVSGTFDERIITLHKLLTPSHPATVSLEKIISAMNFLQVYSIKKNKAELLEFLAEADKNKEPARVRTSTIHGAKGLEFDHVHILNASENVFPHQRTENIEEERRLMYVAITRTKQSLTIYSVGQSQFIAEML